MLECSGLWSDPDEFYLSDSASEAQFEFNARRPVRVCVARIDEAELPTRAAAAGPANVALTVERDGRGVITVERGSCAEFQARSVEVSPAGTVASGWTLHGTIETREPIARS